MKYPKSLSPHGFPCPARFWQRYELLTWNQDPEKFKNRPMIQKTVRVPVGQVYLAVWAFLSYKRRELALPPLTDEDWEGMTIEEINGHAEEALSHFLELALEREDWEIQTGKTSLLDPLPRTI